MVNQCPTFIRQHSQIWDFRSQLRKFHKHYCIQHNQIIVSAMIT